MERTITIKPGEAERDPRGYASKANRQETALAVATPVIFFILWEIFARAGVLDVRFFPAPSAIFMSAVEMARSGMLQQDVLASALRVLAGFAIGVISGLGAALLLGLSRLMRAALEPFLTALYTVPKLALLPLLLLIFGLGELPSVLLVGMTVFFLVWIQCMEAVLAIPENYREAARSFGAKGWVMFRHVTWPALLPQFFISMRIAIGTAVLVIVGVEFVQASQGIGYRIWHSWSLFQANRMYVGICTVALMGFLFSTLVRWLGRLMLPWTASTTKSAR
ncbi:ABC transporter permease [Aminobacter sp. MET-1]|uniref:ABC transporter permease n=1 Tax=Aminobacter sp. MET-1 TaxID=2951085 RepID=UPI00226A8D4E|nr:ABC transporter permease [Aminobacter sp. MET-1]MCX8572110.1 ABC transporter permease [Aminobacter sp. MET-1]